MSIICRVDASRDSGFDKSGLQLLRPLSGSQEFTSLMFHYRYLCIMTIIPLIISTVLSHQIVASLP